MNLKEIRKEKKLTQKEIADRLGITQSAYNHWEQNNRTPDSNTVIRLAEILEVSVDRLLGVESYADSRDILMYDVIGTIRAGYDGEAIESPTGERVPIPRQFLKGYRRQDFFVLRIAGDSMYPKFLDGDFCLVHRCTTVDSNKVACILLNDTEATIKTIRYVNGEDWLELIPANPEFKIKRIEGPDLQSCHILGEVTKLIRDI